MTFVLIPEFCRVIPTWLGLPTALKLVTRRPIFCHPFAAPIISVAAIVFALATIALLRCQKFWHADPHVPVLASAVLDSVAPPLITCAFLVEGPQTRGEQWNFGSQAFCHGLGGGSSKIFGSPSAQYVRRKGTTTLALRYSASFVIMAFSLTLAI